MANLDKPAAVPEADKAANKAVQEQLARISNSVTFRGAGRLRRFLEFIVAETLAGRKEQIKEYVVGVAVFDKPDTFDPRNDPIVRVQARRLRAVLERYYHDEGYGAELVIELPKGGYAPVLKPRAAAPARTALAVALVNRNTVAVQAIADHSHQAELGYFCQGLQQELVCALAQVPGIRVLASPPDGRNPASGESAAALLAGGSVRKSREALRVIVHLMDGASGCYLWSDGVDGELADLFALQQKAARLLAAQVQSEAAGGDKRQARRPAENLAARNLYLQGRYHLNQRTEESLRKAAEFFERAMLEDPQYALAHSGLADAYSLLSHYGVLAPAEVWTKTVAHATTGVMLDPNSVEAQTSLAHVKASQDWDWAGAERQFRHAISLDPGYATAHHWYAMNCLSPTGRLAEALDEVRIAQSLDPVSAIIARDLALIYCYRREYELALEQCDHTIELNPHFSAAFWTLALIQQQRQDFEEAAAACQRAIHLSPASPRMYGALGYLYALTGKRKLCLELLDKLREFSAARYVSPMEFASVHFAMGQNDTGFEWLAKACQDRCIELLSINVDPRFDQPRQDRRFADVVRQLGLASDRPRPAKAPKPPQTSAAGARAARRS
ncbi:MAG TPA: hypothetical protein VNF74_13930 [Terriglobales bacterium]|nr:hypothetical protein [Terriglobales bacterium]